MYYVNNFEIQLATGKLLVWFRASAQEDGYKGIWALGACNKESEAILNHFSLHGEIRNIIEETLKDIDKNTLQGYYQAEVECKE